MRNSFGNSARLRAGLLVVLTLVWVSGVAPFALGAEKASAVARLSAEFQMTPDLAAQVARQEVAGRVLAVTPLKGGKSGFRVRILLDGGRVTTVVVGPEGGILQP